MNNDKVNIGAVQLGIPTDKKFISSLLPDGYTEIVYDNDRFYACKCKHDNGNYMDNADGLNGDWERFCAKLKSEFSDNLMEIHSITSQGAHFVVYLKK